MQISEAGTFDVNPRALEILAKVEGPCMVVGVVGLYRTGKSYLLNRVILNRESGFGISPSISACTKGIWMWGKPLRLENEDGRVISAIVLDSEGLGALDQDSAHDCRIFALVLLLSSLLVYNSVGTIDENSISDLSLVVNLTKHIQVKTERPGEEDDSAEFG